MRHRNAGLRKLCEHPRRTWAKCACSWHFSFKWGMTHHRFSLDKHFKRRIESKIEATSWRAISGSRSAMERSAARRRSPR